MTRFMTGIILAALFAWPASAKKEPEYFEMSRVEFAEKVIAALDALPIPVPLPHTECGKPVVINYCRGSITPSLTFTIIETYPGDEIEEFQQGKIGVVYEASAELRVDGASDLETNMFTSVCIAIVAAATGISTQDAAAGYEPGFRKALNRASAVNVGEWQEIADWGNTIYEVSLPNLMRCRVTGENDLPPPQQ